MYSVLFPIIFIFFNSSAITPCLFAGGFEWDRVREDGAGDKAMRLHRSVCERHDNSLLTQRDGESKLLVCANYDKP